MTTSEPGVFTVKIVKMTLPPTCEIKFLLALETKIRCY